MIEELPEELITEVAENSLAFQLKDNPIAEETGVLEFTQTINTFNYAVRFVRNARGQWVFNGQQKIK